METGRSFEGQLVPARSRILCPSLPFERWRWRVDEHAAPELDADQGQEGVGSVDPPRAIRLDDPGHRGRIEESSCVQRVRRERVVYDGAQRAAQPVPKRCAEADLTALEDFARKAVLDRFPEDPFPRAAALLDSIKEFGTHPSAKRC